MAFSVPTPFTLSVGSIRILYHGKCVSYHFFVFILVLVREKGPRRLLTVLFTQNVHAICGKVKVQSLISEPGPCSSARTRARLELYCTRACF